MSRYRGAMWLDDIPVLGDVNKKLAGWPDSTLTIVLALLIGLGIIVLLWGPPVIKAGLITYWLLP